APRTTELDPIPPDGTAPHRRTAAESHAAGPPTLMMRVYGGRRYQGLGVHPCERGMIAWGTTSVAARARAFAAVPKWARLGARIVVAPVVWAVWVIRVV